MKMIFFYILILLALSNLAFCNTLDMQSDCFSGALTSGFVFKHGDCRFKKVYGRGMVNVITGDFCYYTCNFGGIGAKVSYWRASGRTTCFKKCACLQEVPITLYLRGLLDLNCCLQLYASLGGGAIWLKENSYLCKVRKWRGIGEVEIGLNYPILNCLDFTTAFRYLFPRQSQDCKKIDVGGCDLRAGFRLSF